MKAKSTSGQNIHDIKGTSEWNKCSCKQRQQTKTMFGRKVRPTCIHNRFH